MHAKSVSCLLPPQVGRSGGREGNFPLRRLAVVRYTGLKPYHCSWKDVRLTPLPPTGRIQLNAQRGIRFRGQSRDSNAAVPLTSALSPLGLGRRLVGLDTLWLLGEGDHIPLLPSGEKAPEGRMRGVPRINRRVRRPSMPMLKRALADHVWTLEEWVNFPAIQCK